MEINEGHIRTLKRAHSGVIMAVSALVHVPLLMCLVLLLVLVVPSFEGMFQTLGAELPKITQIVLTWGLSVRAHWMLWMGVLWMAILADAAIVGMLMRHVGRTWAWLYSFAFAGLIAAAGLTVFLSMYVPLFRTAADMTG